jgi:hypothetical protein
VSGGGVSGGGVSGGGVSGPVLQALVFVRGENRPFGTLTLHDVSARADELRAATGWGPTARVGPVAHAWRELAIQMQRAGAATVAELDPGMVAELAPKLWVVPPGGGLLP